MIKPPPEKLSHSLPRQILIVDNAISNGGDAAILLVMQESLRAVFGADVEIRVCFCGADSEPGVFCDAYPEVVFVPTLWHTDRRTSTVRFSQWRQRLRHSLPLRFRLQAVLSRRRFPRLLLNPAEYELLREYQQADVIVVSGGGFLNTAWTPAALRPFRIAQYRAALLLRKPLVFYAQSFGPFASDDPLPDLLRPILRQAALVLCRDERSTHAVQQLIGDVSGHVHQTMDEAFLLVSRSETRLSVPLREQLTRVGICVHQWHWQGADNPEVLQQEFETRIVEVCSALLAADNTELIFLTTHQGMEGLHRDDVVSCRIWEHLPAHLQSRAHLITGFAHPTEFAAVMGACDVVVSSRLHGAILSLVGGAPALALAYEPKTSELMRELELEDWALSMWHSSAADILAGVSLILSDLVIARSRQQAALAKGREMALRNRALLHSTFRPGK